MKAIPRIVVLAALSLGVASVAVAGEFHVISAGSSSVSDVWTVDVPAGTFAHSYVVAQSGGSWSSGYTFGHEKYTVVDNPDGSYAVVYNGYVEYPAGITTYDGDPQGASASIQAGIAGPPAGRVYLANVSTSGYYNSGTDEQSATLAGGTYQIWHGGGTSGNGGLVTASTDLSW